MGNAIDIQTVGSAVVIALGDPWDPSADEDIAAELLACGYTTRPRDVLVDLSAIRRLPSAVIGGLVSLQMELTRDGRRLTLLRLSPTLKGQLAQLHLDQVFELEDCLSEAVRHLERNDSEQAPHDQNAP